MFSFGRGRLARMVALSALATILGVAALGLPAFASMNMGSGSSSSTGSSSTTSSTGAAVVTSRTSPYGEILEDAAGYTLYTFSGDEIDFHMPTACTSQNTTFRHGRTVSCSEAWPPLLTTGTPVAQGSVSETMLGEIKRPDGKMQVTYNGHPLYLYNNDTAPGQIMGENMTSFFGVWHVVNAAGEPDAGVATLQTETTKDGTVLAVSGDMGTLRSLYMLTADPKYKTTCVSMTGCTSIWPPLLTTAIPKAGPGVNASMLGTITRPSGTMQVTYNGYPLYLYAFDMGPGDAPTSLTNGEYLIDPHSHGVWYLMSTNGMPNPGVARLEALTIKGSSSFSTGSVAPGGSRNGSGSGGGSASTASSQQVVGVVSGGMPPSVFAAYDFLPTSSNMTFCTGGCSIAWPPVLTTATPAANGLSGEIGTIKRPSGLLQVTYNGHPLYLYGMDQPSEGLGNGISAFGGRFELASASVPSSVPSPSPQPVLLHTGPGQAPLGHAPLLMKLGIALVLVSVAGLALEETLRHRRHRASTQGAGSRE